MFALQRGELSGERHSSHCADSGRIITSVAQNVSYTIPLYHFIFSYFGRGVFYLRMSMFNVLYSYFFFLCDFFFFFLLFKLKGFVSLLANEFLCVISFPCVLPCQDSQNIYL